MDDAALRSSFSSLYANCVDETFNSDTNIKIVFTTHLR